jgi:large subunit ribosomal protein L24
MSYMRIRRDDVVEVISGKDAGKRGRVLRADPKKSRVYVEGLNIVKRHQRPRSIRDTQRGGQVGGVIEKEGPIHVSNVMLVDPKDDRRTRVRMERRGDGKPVRVTKQSGTRIER